MSVYVGGLLFSCIEYIYTQLYLSEKHPQSPLKINTTPEKRIPCHACRSLEEHLENACTRN